MATIVNDFRPAHMCFGIAQYADMQARAASEIGEKRHHAVVGVAFVAFAAEAMLNHYAKVLGVSEEKNSPRGKQTHKSRTEFHGDVFMEANLESYRGGACYGKIRECLKLRDLIVHGKTDREIIKHNGELPKDPRAKIVAALNIPSNLETKCIAQLTSFLEALEAIQNDIEEHGYYPNQNHLPIDQRKHLCEMPLRVSGVRMV